MKYKRRINKLLFSVSLFLITVPVLAYTSVDYEVSSVTIDDAGNISLRGWGRLFAGNCTNEKCLNNVQSGFDDTKKIDMGVAYNAYESGYNSSGYHHSSGTTNTRDKCGNTMNGEDVRYVFQMSAIDAGNGRVLETKTLDRTRDAANIPTVNLTYAMCQKEGEYCSSPKSYQSGCYHDVGWYFRFNSQELVNKSSNGSFKLRLTIISGFDSSVSSSVNIKVLSGAVNISDPNIKKYIDTEEYVGDSILLQALRPNGWSDHRYSSNKVWDQMSRGTGYTYTIQDTFLNNGETWYKIINKSNRNVWVPSAWIVPATGVSEFTVKQTPGFQSCDENSNSNIQEATKSADTCDNNVPFSFDPEGDSSSCLTSSTKYYDMVCEESANVQITNNISERLIKTNTVQYSGTITGEKKCTFTINSSYFNEKIQDFQNKYTEYIAVDPDLANAYSISFNSNITSSLNNYNNLVKKNTYYSMSSINGKIVLLDSRGSIVEQSNVSILTSGSCDGNDCESYNNNLVEQAEIIARNNGKCFTINNIEVCNIEIGNDSASKLKYVLNFSGQHAVNTSGDLTLQFQINNIGSHGKWHVRTNCTKNVANGSYYYRIIDVENPFDFRSSNSSCSDAGANWCNSKTDYTKVASIKETNNDNYEYSITLTRESIEKIKSSNALNKKSGDGYVTISNTNSNADCLKNNKGVLNCNTFFNNYTNSTNKK